MSLTLITGAKGQLGSEFSNLIPGSVSKSRSELDICDLEKTKNYLKKIKPNVLINCAAYTAVDLAEKNKSDCFNVNSFSVMNLAKICKEINCLLVHISSDYVFGKDKERKIPYSEEDPTGPLGIYGLSKELGEDYAKTIENHLIIRTCGLYSFSKESTKKGRNFIETMLTISDSKSELSIVNDQFCAPSYIPHVAKSIMHLIEKKSNGIFNVTNSGETNWFNFAKEIFNQFEKEIKIKPIKSIEYPSLAQRPSYSILCSKKIKKELGYVLPPWKQGISDYLKNT